MRVGFVIYRFRPEIVCGAGYLVERLAGEMARRGHDVSIFTTTATQISQPDRWRVHWQQERDTGPSTLELPDAQGGRQPVSVERHPIKPALPPARYARRLQRYWEAAHQYRLVWLHLRDKKELPEIDSWKFGPGWQLPEFHGGACLRWTTERAILIAPTTRSGGHLKIVGSPLRPNTKFLAQIEHVGDTDTQPDPLTHTFAQPGSPEEVTIPIPAADPETEPILLEISVDATKPRGETRTLGLLVSRITWEPAQGPAVEIPLYLSSILRTQDILGTFPHYPVKGSFRRFARIERGFDRSRGPNVPKLERRLQAFADQQDALLFAAMPFATVSWPKFLEKGAPPYCQIPCRHAEDDYYYLWHHYDDAMRAADRNLLLTQAEAADMPTDIQQRCTVMGGGVEISEEFSWPEKEERTSLRQKLELPEEAELLFFLGRKSFGKGYIQLLEGVTLANARLAKEEREQRPFLLTMAGPDADGMPFPEGAPVKYFGRVPGETKRDLFRTADLFTFFSESESFGLVMLEAWAAGCPVLGGQACGAVREVAESLGGWTAPNSPAAICETLLKWRALPERDRRRLWEGGLEKLTDFYSWQSVTDRAEQVLREITGISK